MGPPPLWWRRGSSLPTAAWMRGAVGMAARGHGRHDLEGCPLWHATQASMMAGGVLRPRQAVAYTRGKSMTAAPDLGLTGLYLGSRIFFIIENWSLMSTDINSRHQKWTIFYVTQRVLDLVTNTKDRLPAVTKNCFCSSVIRWCWTLAWTVWYWTCSNIYLMLPRTKQPYTVLIL
jgi:hypothetical protein